MIFLLPMIINLFQMRTISKEVNENIAVINKNINNPVYKLNNSKIIGSLPIADITGNNIGYINVIQSREVFLSTQKLTQRNGFLLCFYPS